MGGRGRGIDGELRQGLERDRRGAPNCSSGGRRLLASLAAHCAVGGVARLVNALHAGGGGRNTATTTTTKRVTARRRVTRRRTRRCMRTPRRRSRRPTCPASPSSGSTSLADRRLPSPWTTRLPRAIDRSTMVKARTPRRATTTTATTTIRPSRRCRRGRATLPPMSGVVFPPAVGAGARGGRGGGGGWRMGWSFVGAAAVSEGEGPRPSPIGTRASDSWRGRTSSGPRRR